MLLKYGKNQVNWQVASKRIEDAKKTTTNK